MLSRDCLGFICWINCENVVFVHLCTVSVFMIKGQWCRQSILQFRDYEVKGFYLYESYVGHVNLLYLFLYFLHNFTSISKSCHFDASNSCVVNSFHCWLTSPYCSLATNIHPRQRCNSLANMKKMAFRRYLTAKQALEMLKNIDDSD